MRIHLFSLILLTFYLSACAAFQPIGRVSDAVSESKVTRPPRFVNFETGANVKSLAFEGEFLWLGLSNGIIRYDTSTLDHYEIYTTRSTDGLLAKGIYKIAIDSKGEKWIGTYGGGLSHFDGKNWQVFTPYGGGKLTYDASWTIYPKGKGLGDLWVYDIFFDDDGSSWIATWKGVSHFDGKSFTTYTEEAGLLDKWVYAIAKDQDGLFWFGTEGGLNSFDGRTWKAYTHKEGLGAKIGGVLEGDAHRSGHHQRDKKGNQIGNPNYVLDIAVDLNNVKWIGTWGAGLSRFDGQSWQTYIAGTGTIGGNFVHALEIDSEGNLWAGTDKGVTLFDGKTWTTYTTKDGLLNDNVFSIAFDRNGNKWFGTWTGLSQMIE